MKNNKLIIIVLAIVILALIGGIFLVGDKNLDPESKEIEALYKYLGNSNNLNTYSLDSKITKDTLSDEVKAYNVYYNLDNKVIKENTLEGSCKVGDITFESHLNKCNYKEILLNDFNNTYKKIYGIEYKPLDKFNIDSNYVCYKEGERYLCGEVSTFTYSLGNEGTIYRFIDKALEKKNNKIIIYDYYLKISNNICYKGNNDTDGNKDCQNELNKEIDVKFIKKFGSEYKHTFLKDDTDNYYWYSSENLES